MRCTIGSVFSLLAGLTAATDTARAQQPLLRIHDYETTPIAASIEATPASSGSPLAATSAVCDETARAPGTASPYPAVGRC